jgi:hypothetical protein
VVRFSKFTPISWSGKEFIMLIFGDPCGLFYSTTVQATQNLWQSLNGSISTSGLPAGNIGATALHNIGVSGGVITVPSTAGPYIVGFRLCLTSGFSEQQIASFRDPTNGVQVVFATESNGTINAYRGSFGGALLGSSSLAVTLSQNVWAYVELQSSIDATAGAIGVRINGVSVLQTTGNTKNTGSSFIGNITIGSNLTSFIQDVVVTDSLGLYNNTYLGDVHLSGYNAATAGTPGINQYTPNGAATIPLCVSAVTPADGAVFASDANPGDRMSVGVANTAVTGTVAALIHISRVKKDAAGTRTFAQTITSNGTDAVGPTQAPGTTYAYYAQISEVDPNTNLPWTTGSFNAPVQCGIETVA